MTITSTTNEIKRNKDPPRPGVVRVVATAAGVLAASEDVLALAAGVVAAAAGVLTVSDDVLTVAAGVVAAAAGVVTVSEDALTVTPGLVVAAAGVAESLRGRAGGRVA